MYLSAPRATSNSKTYQVGYPVRSQTGYKVTRKSTRKSRYASYDKLAAKRLNNGIQWKQTLYGDECAITVPSAPILYYANIIADIPKYRNDALASAKQANLQQARTSDKLFLKGFKVNLSLVNQSTKTSQLRVIMFRSATTEEVPSGTGTNWIEALDGTAVQPSTQMSTAMTERFNYNLVKNKRVDMIFDKKLVVGSDGIPDGKNVKALSFYCKCNHTVQFESKGDSSSADDLKTGKYWLLLFGSNTADSYFGTLDIHWDINAVWAEA